jgi:ABC-type amino acid transport substrate-binding protein
MFSNPVRFIGFENPSEGFTALQGGSVDAYTNDGPIVYGLLKSTPDPAKWRVFDAGVDASTQAFPLRQNSSSFATIINLTIVEVCESGRWQELYHKYFVPVGLPRELDETSKFVVRLNSWSD